jgi:hypothetical protein
MEGLSQTELNAIGAANIGAAVLAGGGGGFLGQKLAERVLAKKMSKAGADAVGDIAGDIGGNIGGLALQLITQGATGQLTGDVFGEDIKVLIIGEILEKALTKLAGVGAGPLMVVQLVGAILDTFWDPFKAYSQGDLDQLHTKYQQAMVDELYPQKLRWPLVVTPEILPLDTEGNIAAPVMEQIRQFMRQYLDLKGLVYVEDIIQSRLMSELSDFQNITFLSSATGTLHGSLANLGLQAQVMAARMVTLYVRYRDARKKIAEKAAERARRQKVETAKKYVGYFACFLCVVCLVVAIVAGVRRAMK